MHSVGRAVDRNIYSIVLKAALTESSELFDDSSQGAVGDTLQLTGDPIRQSAATQISGFNNPLHQRHG